MKKEEGKVQRKIRYRRIAESQARAVRISQREEEARVTCRVWMLVLSPMRCDKNGLAMAEQKEELQRV